MSIGKIGEFCVQSDTWSLYCDRLEQYFLVNKVDEELKVPTLITLIGSEAYELLVNLCTPKKPAEHTYVVLVQIMADHLQPRPSILAERYKFRQRKQELGETIAQYAEALKKMSRYCEFQAWLDDSLRDQFVCGVQSELIRQRLFAEDKITYAKAFKLAVGMEAAEKDAAEIGGQRRSGEAGSAGCHKVTSSEPARTRADRQLSRSAASTTTGDRVHRQRKSEATPVTATTMTTEKHQRSNVDNNYTKTCSACGGSGHTTTGCKFRTYTCRKCLRVGHLQRMCGQSSGMRGLHHVVERQELGGLTDSSDDDGEAEVTGLPLYHIDLQSCRPITLSLLVDGRRLELEVDTGSAVTCIGRRTYERLFSHLPLEQCNLVLKYYTGETVTPDGKFRTTVQYKDVIKNLDVYVVGSGKVCLLGRQWLGSLAIDIPVLAYHKVDVGKQDCKFDLNEFMSRYGDVFADGLGRYTGGTVSLRVREGAVPCYLRARPLAYALKEKVERELEALVQSGILTPVETSDWATPIVPVLKKTGDLRICADYKITVNKVLDVDRFPVPRVEDVLAKLQGGIKFSTIDLSQAYAQLELDEASRKFTVINTHKGLFRYNRLVYGLSSSPGIFQRKLEQLFSDLPYVGVFLDDIIVTGRNAQEHLETLNRVFQRLLRFGLKIRKEKCSFFAESVKYLGFIINRHGIHTCQDKVEAIENTPTPTCVTELRAFLGLVIYYARFIRNVSTILSPLYDLLKKEREYVWSDECERAFVKIKRLLASSPVLAHYSTERPLLLTTDASSVGVAAILSHGTPEGERPVAYASRTLTSAEKGYSQIDKEALAIIFGIRKFHQYLYGRKFTLRTDHKALVSIFGNKVGIPQMAASRLQRWAVMLTGYDYDVEYVNTKLNCADGLSRLPARVKKESGKLENTYVNFVENALPLRHTDIKTACSKDQLLSKVHGYLRSGWPPTCPEDELKPYFLRRNELYLDSGCIMWGYRMVIPEIYRKHILRELHSGHMGIVKTKGVARSYVWWPGVDADVERACKECRACNEDAQAPPRAAPRPWTYPTEPWTRLHVDFFKISGMTFFTIKDATTKWIEVFEMKSTTAKAVIKKLRETFARFGICAEMVSDNGPPFNSVDYAAFAKNNGIKLTFSSVYHQSSNGSAENAVKLCKKALRKAATEKVDFNAALQSYLLAYRNAEHSTTGAEPAVLLQHRRLRSRLDLLQADRGAHVRAAQARQVEAAGGVERSVNVGEDVWARNYSGRDRWQAGQVVDQLGSRNFTVRQENGQTVKRHIDQIRRRTRFSDIALPPDDPQTLATCAEPASVEEQTTPVPATATPSPLKVPPSRVHEEVEPERIVAVATPVSCSPRPKRFIKPIIRYGSEI